MVQEKVVVGVNEETNVRFSFSSLCATFILASFLLFFSSQGLTWEGEGGFVVLVRGFSETLYMF